MEINAQLLSRWFVSVIIILNFTACTPVPIGPIPDYSGYPVDEATGIRAATLADDASKLPDVPGSYEWWNFFAFDSAGDLGISMIFLSGNLWDTQYRQAVHAWRSDPEGLPQPDPKEAFLLQLNVTKGEKKIFTAIKNPPGTSAEFSRTEPYGRIGQSTFQAVNEGGVKTYYVHIDAPDMMNLNRLEAEVVIRAASPGFAIDGFGLYGRIPGGSLHHWQFPVGYPETSGTVRIFNKFGAVVFEEAFSGGGYTDHMWGEGFCGDMLDSWYFGRVDLGAQGALIYLWLTPRDKAISPYGRIIRIPVGTLPILHEANDFIGLEAATSGMGLNYYHRFQLPLTSGGEVEVRFGDPAVEDWPFQVAGPASISVSLPGDIEIVDQPGPGEYLWQPGIDDPYFYFLTRLLPLFPWFQ